MIDLLSSTTVNDQLTLSGIQDILDLEGITEVSINRPYEIWFDRGNGWETKELPQLSFEFCMDLAKSLSVYAGLTNPIGIENPVASVILPNGERGQVLVPPATEKNIASITIRKPSTARFTLEDYQSTGRFNSFDNVDIE